MSSGTDSKDPSANMGRDYKLNKDDINEAMTVLKSLSSIKSVNESEFESEEEPLRYKGYHNPYGEAQPTQKQEEYDNPFTRPATRPKTPDLELAKLNRKDLANLSELDGTGPHRKPMPKLKYEPDYLSEEELITTVRAAAKDLYKMIEHNESLNRSSNRYDPSARARKRDHDKKVNNIVNRLYESREQQDHRMEMLRNKHEEIELSTMKEAPTISAGSKEIIKNHPIRPLYKRYKAIQFEREEARFRAQMEAEDRRREKELLEGVPYERSKSQRKIAPRDVSNYMKDYDDWKMQKADQIQLMELERMVAEMDGLTFQPHVGKKSREIFEHKLRKEGKDMMKIEDRLLRYKVEKKRHLKSLEEDMKPSFSPILSRKTRVIVDQLRKRHEDGFSVADNGEEEEVTLKFVQKPGILESDEDLDTTERKERKRQKLRSVSRSKTPTRKQQVVINVVEYNPQMDFLCKKVKNKKRLMEMQ